MLGPWREPCSQDRKCWKDRRARSGCRKQLWLVPGPYLHTWPTFLGKPPPPIVMCVQSLSSWLACNGVSGEAPRGRAQINTGYRRSGQQRCHDHFRGLQSSGSSCPGSPTWLGKQACLQGVDILLAVLSKPQSWEILSVRQRETDAWP